MQLIVDVAERNVLNLTVGTVRQLSLMWVLGIIFFSKGVPNPQARYHSSFNIRKKKKVSNILFRNESFRKNIIVAKSTYQF